MAFFFLKRINKWVVNKDGSLTKVQICSQRKYPAVEPALVTNSLDPTKQGSVAWLKISHDRGAFGRPTLGLSLGWCHQ